MNKKYGANMRWFDNIAKIKDCCRLRSFEFKEGVKRVMRDTEH